jgi:hypothetical protein
MLMTLTGLSATRIVSAIFVLCSVVAYSYSLSLPAYRTPTGTDWPALVALIYGPFDLLSLHVPWLANLFLWASWALWLGGAPRSSLTLAVLAVASASAFWLGEGKVEVATGSSSATYIALSGYFVWLGSTVAQLGASGLLFAESKRTKGSNAKNSKRRI